MVAAAPVEQLTPVAHLALRGMSTDITVTAVGADPTLLTWAQERLQQLEARWSRFLPTSDISRLNAADGRPTHVSSDTLLAVRAACAAWVHTGGRFDPTVHDSLLRLGYDQTIQAVIDHSDVSPARSGVSASQQLPTPGCAGIVLDDRAGTITLPLGVRLDLGGIGKGLAADLVATGLRERGAEGALVDIGGDVRVTGTSPRGGAWTIAIEDPRNEHLLALVHVDDGGVATSTTLRRRWIHAGARRHHLVAPTTGESTTSDVVGASVVAATAGWADALSKVAFVDPAHVVDTLGPASALIMTSDGASTVVGPDVFEWVEP